MIKINLDKNNIIIKQLVDNKHQELSNILQFVRNIDLKMIDIFEKMYKRLPNLTKFTRSVAETMQKSILICEQDPKISEIENLMERSIIQKIGMQFSEKLGMHSKEISEIETLISDIHQLKKNIVSSLKQIEEIKEGAVSLKEQNTGLEEQEEVNDFIIEKARNFLEKNFTLLSSLQKEITEVWNNAIQVLKRIENWKMETSNNIPIRSINLLSGKKEDDRPIFVGTLLGGKAITEGNGKFCIMGTGPGLSWEQGKEIEFDQLTGEWILSLDKCNEKFEYKFAVIFPYKIHWEGCENRTWKPGQQLQEIPSFDYPNSFPNIDKLG